MKKLDDIRKQHPFTVPDGYFDDLAMRVQKRTAQAPRPARVWPMAWRVALPVVLILIALVIYFKPAPEQTPEELLAEISTDALVTYLTESDVTTDELLSLIEVDEAFAEEIQLEVFDESDWLEIDPTEIDLYEQNL